MRSNLVVVFFTVFLMTVSCGKSAIQEASNPIQTSSSGNKVIGSCDRGDGSCVAYSGNTTQAMVQGVCQQLGYQFQSTGCTADGVVAYCFRPVLPPSPEGDAYHYDEVTIYYYGDYKSNHGFDSWGPAQAECDETPYTNGQFTIVDSAEKLNFQKQNRGQVPFKTKTGT